MRHRIAHGYEDVQPNRIWETIKNELPPLRATLERLLGAFDPP